MTPAQEEMRLVMGVSLEDLDGKDNERIGNFIEQTTASDSASIMDLKRKILAKLQERPPSARGYNLFADRKS